MLVKETSCQFSYDDLRNKLTDYLEDRVSALDLGIWCAKWSYDPTAVPQHWVALVSIAGDIQLHSPAMNAGFYYRPESFREMIHQMLKALYGEVPYERRVMMSIDAANCRSDNLGGEMIGQTGLNALPAGHHTYRFKMSILGEKATLSEVGIIENDYFNRISSEIGT